MTQRNMLSSIDTTTTLSSPTTLMNFYALFQPTTPPVRYCSPGIRGAQVESVRGWRAQAKSAQAAGIESSMKKVLISFYRCDVCGIHIGPGYYEQTMYLYPVHDQSINCIDGPMQHFESAWLKVCGGCAHDRRRMVPEWLCLLKPEHWTTTVLLCQEGETPVATDMMNRAQMTALRRAIHEYVNAMYQYVFSLLFLSTHLPLTHLIASPQQTARRRTKGTDGSTPQERVQNGQEGADETKVLQFPTHRTTQSRARSHRIPASLTRTYQIAQ